jgi:HSP20 family molecular chaperone IbpA
MKRHVVLRGVPPRSMADVSRELVRGGRPGRGAVRHVVRRPGTPDAVSTPIAPVNTPRQWRYQTRPSFKRVRGPLVDVFNEAEEVLIVVDLGGFTRGEISLIMTPQHYILNAERGDQRFNEVIGLPANVDTERSRERFVNGVLEIVLPRKKVPVRPARRHTTPGGE